MDLVTQGELWLLRQLLYWLEKVLRGTMTDHCWVWCRWAGMVGGCTLVTVGINFKLGSFLVSVKNFVVMGVADTFGLELF